MHLEHFSDEGRHILFENISKKLPWEISNIASERSFLKFFYKYSVEFSQKRVIAACLHIYLFDNTNFYNSWEAELTHIPGFS